LLANPWQPQRGLGAVDFSLLTNPRQIELAVAARWVGYEDVIDLDRLFQNPTFRLTVSKKIWERAAALDLPVWRRSTGTGLPGQKRAIVKGRILP